MRLWLHSILILVAAQAAFASNAEAKKTACSITINSSEELEVFKKSLDPQEWNFQELVPTTNESVGTNWLSQSCKPEIQCDILMISGHFGGSFFGRTGYSLAMNELETRSCDSRCDGITKRPKEVFLFGCNTLASKKGDSRTPEEYYNVLMADRDYAFTPREASQITALRYSEFGNSFYDQMSQVFNRTPRIYGFSSIAPSGKNVKRLLENYFAGAKSDYTNFDKTVATAGVTRNTKLFTALKVTAIEQAMGFDYKFKSKIERPYCVLADESKTRLSKVRYIQNLFDQQQALGFMSHIVKTLVSTKWDNLTTEEATELKTLRERIKNDTNLQRILTVKNEAFLKVKTDILGLFRTLSIISDADYHKTLAQLITLDQPFTDEKAGLICDLGLNLELRNSDVPAQRWTETPFYYALQCLKPRDLELLQEMRRQTKDDATTQWRSSVLGNLLVGSTANGTASLEHQQFIVELLKTGEFGLNYGASLALYNIREFAPQVLAELMANLKLDITVGNNKATRFLTLQGLVKPHHTPKAVISFVVNELRTNSDTDMKTLFAGMLGKSLDNSPEVLKALNEAASSKESILVAVAFNAIQDITRGTPPN